MTSQARQFFSETALKNAGCGWFPSFCKCFKYRSRFTRFLCTPTPLAVNLVRAYLPVCFRTKGWQIPVSLETASKRHLAVRVFIDKKWTGVNANFFRSLIFHGSRLLLSLLRQCSTAVWEDTIFIVYFALICLPCVQLKTPSRYDWDGCCCEKDCTDGGRFIFDEELEEMFLLRLCEEG